MSTLDHNNRLEHQRIVNLVRAIKGQGVLSRDDSSQDPTVNVEDGNWWVRFPEQYRGNLGPDSRIAETGCEIAVIIQAKRLVDGLYQAGIAFREFTCSLEDFRGNPLIDLRFKSFWIYDKALV